jgi:hypothetical protein
MITEKLNINTEILPKKYLDMNKVLAKMMPKNLTEDQMQWKRDVCADLLQRIEEKDERLDEVISMDESFVFQYDPEEKR